MRKIDGDAGMIVDRNKFPLTRKSERKPLTGVRIVDAGNMVSGPFSAALLADFGADVIKIEHPQHGDGQRKLEPMKDGIPLWWKSLARNKRCVTLDLGEPEGAAIFKDLVRTSDVVIENYRPGTFERWGIGYDVLKAVAPGIILLRISGFGQTGPFRDRPGFGRVAEALAGLSNLIGEPDGPPITPGYPLGDLVAGLFGAYSIMMALYHRDARGGEGQVIDLALYEAVFRLMDFDGIQYDQLNTIHRRTGNQVAYVAPSSTFKTADGKYLTLAASTESVWLRVAKAIDREDLISNPKFIDNPTRVEHSDEINGIVGAWIAQHPLTDVAERFEQLQVAFSPIYDIADIFRCPQYWAREAMVRVPDAELGEAMVPNVVPKFSKTPGSVDFLGAQIGAHNEDVYCRELGFSREKLEDIKSRGII